MIGTKRMEQTEDKSMELILINISNRNKDKTSLQLQSKKYRGNS